MGAASVSAHVCLYLPCLTQWTPSPLHFIHVSGLKEPVAGKAEHCEMPSGDHSANKEAGPSLSAGIQRPEWNCKYTSNHTLFQNTDKWKWRYIEFFFQLVHSLHLFIQ